MWLNETWELIDEGDTTNQNIQREEIVVNSLSAKSVLTEHKQLKDRRNSKQNRNQLNIIDSKEFNDSISSLESVGEVDGPMSSIRSKGILDMYAFNPSKGK